MEAFNTGTQSRQAFSSPQMRQAYDTFLNQAKDNYSTVAGYAPQMMNGINSLNDMLSQYKEKGELGDTSYFKDAWGLARGLDQSNLKKMNSGELNAYNDIFTKNMVDATNKASAYERGVAQDLMNQNMILSGMPNGTGHQTAAAKVGAQYAANINAQNQQTYLQRQNQLEQNALQANQLMGNYYNTLANIGLNYAQLSQKDKETLFQGYLAQSNLFNNMINGQNSALNTYGNAVLMGSDPTITTESHSRGSQSSSTTNKESGGFGSILGSVVGGLGSAFTGFGK